MKGKRFNWRGMTKGISEVVCKIAGYSLTVGTIVGLVAIKVNEAEEPSNKNALRFFDYSDAVNTILDSDMFDSSKKRAISILKKHDTSGYYKTIIGIVNSDMFDSSKMELIEKLSGDK